MQAVVATGRPLELEEVRGLEAAIADMINAEYLHIARHATARTGHAQAKQYDLTAALFDALNTSSLDFNPVTDFAENTGLRKFFEQQILPVPTTREAHRIYSMIEDGGICEEFPEALSAYVLTAYNDIEHFLKLQMRTPAPV